MNSSRTYPDIDRREGGQFFRAEARSEDNGVVEEALRRGRTTQPQAEKMTSIPTRNIGIGSKVKKIVKRIYKSQKPSLDDIKQLLLTKDEEGEKIILDFADKIKQEFAGNEILLRGIVEFSNFCRNSCVYCGINRDINGLKRYRLTAKNAIAFFARRAGRKISTRFFVFAGVIPNFACTFLLQNIRRYLISNAKFGFKAGIFMPCLFKE